MSSFFMLKLKHVQQGPNSMWLLVLRNHKNKVKSKTIKMEETKKSVSTQFTAVLNEVMVEYDTKFWDKLFHSFTELLRKERNFFFVFVFVYYATHNIALQWHFQVFSRPYNIGVAMR